MNIIMFSVKSVIVFVLIFCRKLYAEYCEICRNHTMCKYPVPGPGPQCVGYDWSGLLSRDDVIELVARINEKRNFVASGRSRRLPKAANMKKLVWSEELARFAQRWADQCDQSTRPDTEDACRDLPHIPVGQSIATISGPAPGLNVRSFIDIWFMEALDYTGSVSYYNRSLDNKTNHLTQMIWAETDAIGCGRARFFTEYSTILERLVCNFARRGNIHGRPVYARGFPATQCPDRMAPDPEYNALCSVTRGTEGIIYKPTSVSSLLRILNLSNDSAPQEIDPISNSLKLNKNTSNGTSEQRNQRIRHVYTTHTNNSYDFPLYWGLLNNSINNRLQHHQFHQPERGHSRVYHGHYLNNDYLLTSRSEDNKHETATRPYLYLASNARKFNQYGVGGMQRQECTRRQTPCHPSCATSLPVTTGCDNKCTRSPKCNPCAGCGGCEHPSPCPTQALALPIESCGCPAHRTLCPTTPTRCPCNLNCQCLNSPYKRQGSLSEDGIENMPDETRRDENYYDIFPNLAKIRSGDSVTSIVPQQNIPKHKSFWRSRSNKMIKDEDIIQRRREMQLKNQRQKKILRNTELQARHFAEFSDRQKRESDSQVTFKPFWQIEGYSVKPTNMRALRYTTLPLNRMKVNKKSSRRTTKKFETEPITVGLPKTRSRNGKMPVTEKFLSFEELMHLRKINSGIDGRRDNNEQKPEDKPTEKPKETHAEMTYPTQAPLKKHCTRRLTCTWQIKFIEINGSTIPAFEGNNALGPQAAGTRWGEVPGCTRTSTCTRNFMERNKISVGTSDTLNGAEGAGEEGEGDGNLENADDEEYCERRDLKKRNNIDEYTTIEYKPFTESTLVVEPTESTEDIATTKSTCSCNKNYRRKRDAKPPPMNANCCKSEKKQLMSYGDLHYLVLSKILKMWRKQKGSTENGSHKCPCNGVNRTKHFTFLSCITFITILLRTF